MEKQTNMQLQIVVDNDAEREKLERCLAGIERDADAQAALEAAVTIEDVYAVIKDYVSDSFDEYKARVDALIASMKENAKKIKPVERELSEGELDMVVGGGFWSWAWKIAAIAGIALATVAVSALTGGIGGAVVGALAGGITHAIGAVFGVTVASVGAMTATATGIGVIGGVLYGTTTYIKSTVK